MSRTTRTQTTKKSAPKKKAAAKKTAPAKKDTKDGMPINSLVLGQFTTSGANTNRPLKAIRKEIAANKGASVDSFTVSAQLIDRKGNSFGKLTSRIEKCRADIKAMGLPCPQIRSTFYLKRQDVATVQDIYDEATADIVQLRKDLVADWPQLVADAQRQLADVADELVWPDGEEFANSYQINLNWMSTPAPVNAGVLSGLTDEVAARVRATSEKNTKDMLLEAHGAPVKELIQLLADSVKQLNGAKRFRQERFDKIRELGETISRLNWLKLPELDDLAEVAKTAGVESIVGMDEAGRKQAITHIANAKGAAEQTLADLGI